MTLRGALVAVLSLLLSFAVLGCGSTGTGGDLTPAQERILDEIQNPKPSPARAKRVRAAIKRNGTYARYQVTSVQVLADTVILTTRLFPKTSNEGLFLGACSGAQVADWVSNVEVRGADDIGHTVIQDGLCKTLGL